MPLSLLGVIKRWHWLRLERSSRRQGTVSCRSMSGTFIWVSDSEQDVCSTLYRLFGLIWFIWLVKFSFQVLVGPVGSLFAYVLSLCGRCGFGLFASQCVWVFFFFFYVYVSVLGLHVCWSRGVLCWLRRGRVYRAGPSRAHISDLHIPEPPLIASVCCSPQRSSPPHLAGLHLSTFARTSVPLPSPHLSIFHHPSAVHFSLHF